MYPFTAISHIVISARASLTSWDVPTNNYYRIHVPLACACTAIRTRVRVNEYAHTHNNIIAPGAWPYISTCIRIMYMYRVYPVIRIQRVISSAHIGLYLEKAEWKIRSRWMRAWWCVPSLREKASSSATFPTSGVVCLVHCSSGKLCLQ